MKRITPAVVAMATLLAALAGAGSAQATTIGIIAGVGDSFSTGQGNPGTESNPCLPNPEAADSALVAKQLDLDLQLVACSGATTADVITKQLPAIDWRRVKVVTLTAGGNDVGAFGVVGTCLIGDCASRPAPNKLSELEKLNLRIAMVGPALDRLYDEIERRLPRGARVIVKGYQPLVALQDGSTPDPICGLLSPAERWGSLGSLSWLNAMIKSQVEGRRGFRYLPPAPDFDGTGLCGPEPLVLGSNVRQDAWLHPTDEAMRRWAHEVVIKLVFW